MAIDDQNLGQLASPLPPGSPPIDPVDPAAKEQNTEKWRGILGGIEKNPDAMRQLGAIGAWLSAGQPVGNAFAAGMNTHANTLQAREKARQAFEQQGLSERRLTATTESAEADRSLRQQDIEQRGAQASDRMALDRERLSEDKRQADLQNEYNQGLLGIRQSLASIAQGAGEREQFGGFLDQAIELYGDGGLDMDPRQRVRDVLALASWIARGQKGEIPDAVARAGNTGKAKDDSGTIGKTVSNAVSGVADTVSSVLARGLTSPSEEESAGQAGLYQSQLSKLNSVNAVKTWERKQRLDPKTPRGRELRSLVGQRINEIKATRGAGG